MTASYLPLFAILFATIGSSKLPGTHTTYFTGDTEGMLVHVAGHCGIRAPVVGARQE